MSETDRQKFEHEYREWIVFMARDVAQRTSAMSSRERELLVKGYKKLLDPRAVFCNLSNRNRIDQLAGDRIREYVLVETEGVTFFPSIHSSLPGVLDFATAMNRRFFCRDLWFPIIALNREYIRRSSDKVLGFTLEHEFEMSRVYQQISANLRALSNDEKRKVVNSAKQSSVKSLKITQDELIEDEKLMVEISKSQPLIPKPYAEMALLAFIEDNFSDLLASGVPSDSDEEKSFGAGLYEEFKGWSGFSKSTYALFVRELLACLRESDRGYG